MMLLYYMDAEEFLSEEKFKKAMAFVGLKRRDKVNQLLKTEAKCRSLAAGMLLYFCFQEMGIEKLLEEIEIDGNGKPFLPNNQWFFSLSHSGQYAICAVSDKPIGCDIEKKRGHLPKNLKKIFSLEEEVFFERLGTEEKSDFFFSLWTWKESFVKWMGKGIGFPLQTISCHSDGTFKRITYYEGQKLYLKEYILGEYYIHVCAENREFPTKILQKMWENKN